MVSIQNQGEMECRPGFDCILVDKRHFGRLQFSECPEGMQFSGYAGSCGFQTDERTITGSTIKNVNYGLLSGFLLAVKIM